jgi:phosphatidylserine/phosphatidylglycerophosphate/cardiolipin synthase-like enzyme
VSLDGDRLADAVRCAARAARTASLHEKVELLYTGPSSDSIRRTKQGLLEVVRSARESLWVVSFVVTGNVGDVLAAMEERANVGARVQLLIDHRIDHVGNVFARIAADAPSCSVYVWPDEAREFESGKFASLHAKCAVADGRRAFVSSANLSGHAMDHNLEVGYLVTGGYSPRALERYLDRLVEEGVIVARTEAGMPS